MNAYKTYVTVTESQELVLSNLPFKPGQKVEVIVLAEEDKRAMLAEEMRKLFKETQAIPVIQDITEEEIQAEIDAYRRENENY
ncbi:hypothetical protein [Crocosphaera chwakensis]|uniref:Uncharacterized protein n=1 Tax=Crocosphaera chwakensis CCY0110 TaxID=391612 RepID=A3IZQ4_9CHRO|nr:hypothetical protein [Crocosphaera chwakensis]EAZ88047.1 hypothetical protein CY0110_15330 [Crocosphaera chwakensis CCY0110]